MAIKTSGSLAMSEIAAEFGDATPYSLSEFYRGGGKVPNVSQNNAVPLSGAIAIGNFYGAVNQWTTSWTTSWNTSQTTSQSTTTSWSTAWTTSWTVQEGPYYNTNIRTEYYWLEDGSYNRTSVYWAGVRLAIISGLPKVLTTGGWTYYPGQYVGPVPQSFSVASGYYIYRIQTLSRSTAATTSKSTTTSWSTAWTTSQTTSKLTP